MKVDQDRVHQRRIWLTSIAPIWNKVDDEEGDSGKQEEDDDKQQASGNHDEALNLLLHDLARIQLVADEMEKRMMELKKQQGDAKQGNTTTKKKTF